MRKRLKRAPKIVGIPISKQTFDSLSQATKDIINQNIASDEEKNRRLNICKSCPEKRGKRCGLCGCFLKTKSNLLNSECPIGKWVILD